MSKVSNLEIVDAIKFGVVEFLFCFGWGAWMDAGRLPVIC